MNSCENERRAMDGGEEEEENCSFKKPRGSLLLRPPSCEDAAAAANVISQVRKEIFRLIGISRMFNFFKK